MNVKRAIGRTCKFDVPYNPKGKTATSKYWKNATAHRDVTKLRVRAAAS